MAIEGFQIGFVRREAVMDGHLAPPCFIEDSHLSAALALQNMAVLKEVSRKELLRATDSQPSALQTLLRKGVLELWQKPVGRLSSQMLPQQVVLSPLSSAQQEALRQIETQWQKHSVCLLHGVTSSGKTEIYIHLIRKAVEEGRQVLYLLPEIVLEKVFVPPIV